MNIRRTAYLRQSYSTYVICVNANPSIHKFATIFDVGKFDMTGMCVCMCDVCGEIECAQIADSSHNPRRHSRAIETEKREDSFRGWCFSHRNLIYLC